MSVEFSHLPIQDVRNNEDLHQSMSEFPGRNNASSPFLTSPIDEKTVRTRLLEYIESQRTTPRRFYTDDPDGLDGLLESESSLPPPASTPPEYRVPLAKKLIYLLLYFFLNIFLTLSNKELLLEVS